MAPTASHPLSRFVRHVAASCAVELPDPQLLARFATNRDEAAFAALVRRHGPMVLATCRRVLRDWHTAEDCFQATFLLLARKASTLERPESLGPWLHGVATRTALRARSQAARRREVEAQVQPLGEEGPDDLAWRDLRPVLDEAVGGLPEPFRTPFVLHHLQGLTVTEVARRLGWPRGTVATRLSRARQRLRRRLSRRGLTLSAAVLGMALSERVALACVPASLVRMVVRATVTAGAERTPPLALEQGGGKTMLMAKGKLMAALLLAVAAGGGAVLSQSRATVAPPMEGCAAEARAPRGQTSAPTAPPKNRIVATVNGEPILAEEVYAAAFLALPDAFDLAAPECVRRLDRAWRETLDRVVERQVVLQSACAVLKARAPRTLGKVQEAAAGEFNRTWMRAARKRAGRKGEELEAFLRARGTSLAAVRRQWQRDFVAREYLRSRLAPVLDAGTAARGEAARREKERFVARLRQVAVIEHLGRR